MATRTTGSRDFQKGDPRAQYDSIFNKLLKLPEPTLIYPAHDYKGDTVSTIGEEKQFNPRLKVKPIDEHVDLIKNAHRPETAGFPSKAQALCAAIELAEKDGDRGHAAEVLVRHEDDRFITEWVYGEDLHPDEAARPAGEKQI
jgi:hypothetical protein